MGLNIKNKRVHELAREAARLSGRSQTGAIEAALELLLRELGADPTNVRTRQRLDVVRGIALDYAADAGDEHPTVRRVEDLYDDQGLPR